MNKASIKLPVLSCGPSTSENITVGQKLLFKCAIDESLKPSSLAGTPAQTIVIDPHGSDPHDLVILGEPKISDKILEATFTSYKVGHHDFSNVTLKIDDQVFQSSPFSFTVQSVLPPETAETQKNPPQPFPLIDPRMLSSPWWWWAMWGALLAVTLAIVIKKFIDWKKARALKKAVAGEIKIITPREKYTLALQKLESQGFHIRGEYKGFALALTVIIKKAIGEKFSFPAEDLTSEEFFEVLKNNRNFHDEVGALLESIMTSLDQIKFAKIETSETKCSSLIDMAKEVGRILYRGDL